MQGFDTRDECSSIQRFQVERRVVTELHTVVGEIFQVLEGRNVRRILFRDQGEQQPQVMGAWIGRTGDAEPGLQ